MGTRSGDLDPAIVYVIARKEGLSSPDVDTLLNTQSSCSAFDSPSCTGKPNDRAGAAKTPDSGQSKPPIPRVSSQALTGVATTEFLGSPLQSS